MTVLNDGSSWRDVEGLQDSNAPGDAVWRLLDDGSFELLEPYRTMLDEAKIVSSTAWTEALIGYLEQRCPYTAQELSDELIRRNNSREEGKMTVFEEFVIEALSGDL